MIPAKKIKIFLDKLNLILLANHGTHIFTNFGAFEKLKLRLESILKTEEHLRLSESRHLFQLLKGLKFNANWVFKHEKPIYYRRVGRNRDELDVAGSLSDGGRFNLGGAQTSSQFRNEFNPIGNKRGAIYLGEDIVTTQKEFGDWGMLGSTATTYQVQLKRRKYLNLIEVENVLKDLSLPIPNIRSLIGTQSMNGCWGDLKIPSPSQILGHWLMEHAQTNTDGLRFCSTQDKNYFNVCLYMPDARAAKKLLKSQEKI
ncbi:MAG: RES domain-containing protein [Bdellovibrionota bacterium]